jgi:serine/threonine-protein kinase HipA
MPKHCLACFEPVSEDGEYHPRCCKKIFLTGQPPTIEFTLKDMETLAEKSIQVRAGVTGVQPKLSVDLEKTSAKAPARLTVVGLWGQYILKPPTIRFTELPAVESATMRMAQNSGLDVAAHALIRLKSGELAYIARRFDRLRGGTKLAMEDMCQLTELLTEKKYKGSMEKVGKAILEHSHDSGLDAIRFLEIALFSFLTGNADMHLKNFSLLTNELGHIALSSAYDLVATRLLIPDDKEQMALTIQGKRSRLKREDFLALAEGMRIPTRAIENTFRRLERGIPAMLETSEKSFMTKEMKRGMRELIQKRAAVLKLTVES